MARIDSFLRLVVEQGASDLHFLAGSEPSIRHHGELVSVPFRSLSDNEARRFLYEILTQEERERFERDLELDFAHQVDGVGRFRGNAFVQEAGVGAVFRVISARVPELDSLGLPQSLWDLTTLRGGLVLVTGPTGCGKTTTLAAVINEINRQRACHIVTIEDPIEVVHTPHRAIMTQRELGRHVGSFRDAVRSAFSESPDILLVGEMRDQETISLILDAAVGGVLAFSTLHTNSASGTIDRIIDMFPPAQAEQVRNMLSSSLRAIVAQRLIGRMDGQGRVAVVEILFNTTAVANMIREGKIHQIDSMLQSAPASSGMCSLDTSLLRLALTGCIDLPTALAHCRRTDWLEDAFNRRRSAQTLQEET